MKKELSVFAMTLAVSACSSAPKSSEVSAAYVPITMYGNHTCEQLIAETEAIRRSIPGLEAAVDTHRSNQTGVEVITWVLFWPAAFALDKGEQNSSQLAKAKGELQSIQTALMTKKCSDRPNVADSTTRATDVSPRPVQGASSVPEPASMTNSQHVADKLRSLEALKKDKLITEAEYSSKRTQLLERL